MVINRFTLAVLTYGFVVIHWRTADLQQLDRRTRKIFSMRGVYYPATDMDWLYAPCVEGGRGLEQIESTYQSCIVGLDCYLRGSSDPLMQLVQSVMLEGPLIQSYAWPVNLLNSCKGVWLGTTSRRVCMEVHETILCKGVFEQVPQTDAKHFCTCSSSLHVQSYSRNLLHGQYRHLTEEPPVDIKETYGWLKSSKSFCCNRWTGCYCSVL